MFQLGDKKRRNIMVQCDHGMMIVNRFDRDVNQVGQAAFLLDHGNASTQEAQICYQAIGHDWYDPIIFDVGANIGTWTTWIAKTYPTGRLFCFEPQQKVFQILCGNCAINNLENIVALPYALGAETKTVSVREPDYNKNNDFGKFSVTQESISDLSPHYMIIEIRTVDDIMSTYCLHRLNLIKIDAEDMSLQVLQGGRRTLLEHHPVVFCEHNDTKRSQLKEIKEYLESIGYTKFETMENNLLCQI